MYNQENKLNGYILCSLLKNDKRYKMVPVILLTGRTKGEDIKLGERVGADAYITKPFQSPVLLDKVKELLKK
ncbi:MAG TPA: response regulator [Candidatus Omnitrophica bacterium]|nr:response regulator [Candidatus Omnitrophota bacterium]